MTFRRRMIWAALLTASHLSSSWLHAAEPDFPTAVGTRWVYIAGPLSIVEEIVAVEEAFGEKCIRLETRVNDKALSFEHLAVRPDGLYRVSIGGEEVVPPLCFIRFAPKSGETWAVKSKVGEIEVAGQFVAGKSLVVVPAGRYSVVTSQGSKFQSPSGELQFTYFYAPGVGKVKQVIRNGDKASELSLKEFHPGKGESKN